MNELSISTNPFAPESVARAGGNASSNAIAQSDQQRAIAEVQAAMVIARMNPRDQRTAMDRILNACARPSLANAAIYTYARGGTDITGPSIRLAEAMAQNWGNMQFGMRELSQANGESTVQAYAWDVETNTRREITFQVPHVRYAKKGVTKPTDPRDIYELIANQGARRLRACILSVIPGDVTEAAVEQCNATMHAKADTSAEAVAKLVQAFADFGVNKEQIEKRIQRRLDAIQPAQIVQLRKVYASLKEGMSKPAEWFEFVDGDTGEIIQTVTPKESPALPEYTDEKFEKNLSTWRGMIETGQKTADEIIAMVNSKARMQEHQIEMLRATVVTPPTSEEGNQQEAAG